MKTAKMLVFLKKSSKEIEWKKANGSLTMEDLKKLTEGCLSCCDKKEQEQMKAQFADILKEHGLESTDQKKPLQEKVTVLPKRWEC